MNIPIFCIHLERAVERRRKIEDIWIKDLGFDITFWPAVDKNNATDSLDRPCYLKPGECAILLSYIKLFKHILFSNISEVIIIEDDVYPCPIFSLLNKTINIVGLMENYISLCRAEFSDLQLLMMIKPIFHSKQIKIYEELNYCYKMKKAPWGAFLNYYTIDGIKNIHDSILNMKYPIDHYDKMINIQNKIALTKMPFGFHQEYSKINQYKTYK